MKKANALRYLICLAIVALGAGAAFAALITNVPDVQQPPAGSLGNPTDNACAPVSAVNITQYWDVVMGHPNASMVNAGLVPTTAADYLYYFMNTDNWPLPGPPRMNGTPPMFPAAPGTYNVDIMPGFYEFVRWDAAHMFTTPPPALPAGKLGYDWTFTTDYATGFPVHAAQIDSGLPDIVCFTYWNPVISPVKKFEPALGDTVYFYTWGTPQSNSGPPNPVENWNSNTGPEGIGHAVTGIGYYANFSPGGGLPVTNWIVCHDNWPTTKVNVAIPWANWKATITANPGEQIKPPDSLYWKDYNDTLPGGFMPDFDQNQDFNGDGFIDQAFCGPVSIANSLWWFQGKYPDRIIVPPPFYPMNPSGFIQMLATLMKTTPGGTYVDSMQWGIQQYLNMMGLNDLLYEHTVWRPSFQFVEAEIERCQDVTLLVGFWVIEEIFEDMPGHYLVLWHRTGGHYVTSAGVNSQDRFIGLSDPYFDNFEGGVCYGVLRGVNHNHPLGHNDGISASHDIYNVNDTLPCSPGGIWELDHPFWHSPILQTQFYNQNEGQQSMMLPWACPIPPVMGALYSEIEAAVIVSPFELPKINVVPDTLSYTQLISTTNTYTDQIIISNIGAAPLNVTAMSFDLAWVTFSFAPVTLLPGASDTVDVIINTTGILPGPYSGNCHISSNDPSTPVVNKPHIKIRVTAPNIGVSPDSLYHSQQTNTNVTYNSDFTINNSGDGDLLIASATNTLPWITLIGVPAAIPPAGNVSIGLNINTTGILPGIYLDSVTINSNDPTRSTYYKPKIVIQVTPQQVDSLFWKDYNGPEVAGGYMPDFDQNQDFDNNGSIDLGYCGPVSVANSFWWYQGKYPDKQIILPGFYPGNPKGFIQALALLMKTNATMYPGTNVDTMQTGIRQYIQILHLDTLFYEHTIKQPTFDTIVTELVRSQDITLLLGFWYIEEVIPAGPGQWLINWRRTGGHYVTVAGVNQQEGLIGISDPDADNFEMGICNGVLRGLNHIHPAGHNDGVSASHDIYNIGVPPCSPGGLWELEHPYWSNPYLLSRYMNQNGGMFMVTVPWQCPQIEPMVGAIYTEIEAAVIVSPRQPIPCAYKPGDINGDDAVIGGDVTYGVRYFKAIGNPPPDSCWNDSTQNWLYAAGDVNGNCEFRGSDITFLVAYFKSIQPALKWCRWTPPIVTPPAVIREEDKSTPIKIPSTN